MVLVTFGSSVLNAKIMLGMLVKVFRGDSIATCRRLPREGDVTFEDLMSATSNFDVRTVTIEGLTSVRYLLPITVRILTVRAAMRSASLSWSHHACRIDGGFRSLSSEIILSLKGSQGSTITDLRRYGRPSPNHAGDDRKEDGDDHTHRRSPTTNPRINVPP